MSSVRVSFASALVDENAQAVRELLAEKASGTTLDDGVELVVVDAYVERHFDVSQTIVEVLVTVPVDVAATAAAAAVAGFIKRRFRGNVKPVVVEAESGGQLSPEEQEQLIKLLLKKLDELRDRRDEDAEGGEGKESP